MMTLPWSAASSANESPAMPLPITRKSHVSAMVSFYHAPRRRSPRARSGVTPLIRWAARHARLVLVARGLERATLALVCAIGLAVRVVYIFVVPDYDGDAYAHYELAAKTLPHPSAQPNLWVWLPRYHFFV